MNLTVLEVNIQHYGLFEGQIKKYLITCIVFLDTSAIINFYTTAIINGFVLFVKVNGKKDVISCKIAHVTLAF